MFPTLSNARLIYHNKLLFDHLSLTLPENQWTCILGPSGVGKSSLLRLLAYLPTGGKANFESNIHDKDIAYMAQTDLLLPWLSVLDNILISIKLRGEKISSQHKKEALILLEQMGIASHINKKPHQLSGGERQRVALVRTLFQHKKIILMDEPFTSLDAITKWKLQGLFSEYLKSKTVLLITHDPMEALRLGHHIYILSGRPAKLEKLSEAVSYDNLMEKLSQAAEA
jgi:putative hydroxymethylpyrimidine transport system ATP-binding protein